MVGRESLPYLQPVDDRQPPANAGPCDERRAKDGLVACEAGDTGFWTCERDLMAARFGTPEGTGGMTARERRIAELAAQDLESWARELPLGSETRRDLQQTARVYRFAARAGAGAVALRAVPDPGAEEEAPAIARPAAPRLGADQAPDRAAPAEAARALDLPLGRGT